MKNLSVKATQYTPEVLLNTSGTISIKGKSYPENSFEFYSPIMEWLRAYLVSDKETSTLNVAIELDYFNSSTSSVLYDMFDLFDDYHKSIDIQIYWYYKKDNESLQETGEEFCEDFSNLNMQLHEV